MTSHNPKNPKNNDVHAKSEKEFVPPQIVGKEEWLEQRRALLAVEKDVLRANDAMLKARRALPWYPVGKEYTFIDVEGKEIPFSSIVPKNNNKTLIIQYFMAPDFPGFKELGCSMCSLWSDTVRGYYPQLTEKAEFALVMHAPSFEAFKKIVVAKKFPFPCYQTKDITFGEDFGTAQSQEKADKEEPVMYNFKNQVKPFGPILELPSFFVFSRNNKKNETGGGEGSAKTAASTSTSTNNNNNDTVFLTYATQSRGLEPLSSFWAMLDMLPEGRSGHNPRHREEILAPSSEKPPN